jgi:hypothetical protein
MKPAILVPVIAAACLVLLGMQGQSMTQPPAGHPPILPQGHPQVQPGQQSPTPTGAAEARPEDVRSVAAIVTAYYSIISGEKGEEREWDRFRSLFAPDARFITLRPSPGGMMPVVLTPEQFIVTNKNYFERGGYFERQVAQKTELYGNIAHVFSTYETRRNKDDPQPYSRGINSMQLIGNGERWWITTIMWDYERKDNPIPPRYLSTLSDEPASGS